MVVPVSSLQTRLQMGLTAGDDFGVPAKTTMGRKPMDVQAPNLKDTVNPNKALWEKGDFTEIAATMRESGEALVRSLGIKLPLRVLDLGSGDGTTALPLARLGADVTGIDIARNLVE